MKSKGMKFFVVGTLIAAGCVSSDLSTSRRVDVDDENVDGGISSVDIRTVASKMCPSLLSSPDVASRQPPIRIKIANVKNTSRFFIDGDMFAKMLRTELNKFSGGQIRFLEKNEKTQVARSEVLKDRQLEAMRENVCALGKELGKCALFQDSPELVKVAVLPMLNANLVNMNPDSVAAIIRSEILSASCGKVLFMMPGHIKDADYWLTGQFYPENQKKEESTTLAEYIEILSKRVEEGKTLYKIAAVGTEGAIDDSLATTPRERALLDKLRSKPMCTETDVDKRLSVMIFKPSDRVCVYEKSILFDGHINDHSGSAALILSCEISALSQALNGVYSDYLVVAMQLVDPESNEVVWEDSYEVKRMSRAGIVYR